MGAGARRAEKAKWIYLKKKEKAQETETEKGEEERDGGWEDGEAKEANKGDGEKREDTILTSEPACKPPYKALSNQIFLTERILLV